MPRLVNALPVSQLHRASGQAVVTLDGRKLYLGPHNTPQSRQRYEQLIAAWLGNGRQLPTELANERATVDELLP